MVFDTAQLSRHFGQAATYYHHHAKVQQYAADRLLDNLEAQAQRLPLGKILELGCGTGFLSQGLVEIFPHHALCITDLSPQMVQFCKTHLAIPGDRSAPVTFDVLDGERWAEGKCDRLDSDNFNHEPYSLITSNFVLQWFHSPAETLKKLCQKLHPQGRLVVSFPSVNSFPELREYCNDRAIPYPLNPLPNFTAIAQSLHDAHLTCDFQMEWFSETFGNVKQAFQHLKALGARSRITTDKISYSDLRKLLESDRNLPIVMSYHIVFLTITPHSYAHS